MATDTSSALDLEEGCVDDAFIGSKEGFARSVWEDRLVMQDGVCVHSDDAPGSDRAVDFNEGEFAVGAIPAIARRVAAKLDEAGKHEPALSEAGIPSKVLEALLPGDDVIELEEPEVAGGLAYRFFKRTFDVFAAGVALVLLAVPMLVIAARIKFESDGPAIYAQHRTGRQGKSFKIYKFRSMYVGAEKHGAQWAADDDPRVTPFGKVMRAKRLDEIPQFWNVVKGDMSLVGPRPERPAFCEEFEKRIVGWHYRTLVRPGVSGLAQITGGYDLLPKEKVVLDFEYIENRGIRMDLAIILKTLKILESGDGAR